MDDDSTGYVVRYEDYESMNNQPTEVVTYGFATKMKRLMRESGGSVSKTASSASKAASEFVGGHVSDLTRPHRITEYSKRVSSRCDGSKGSAPGESGSDITCPQPPIGYKSQNCERGLYSDYCQDRCPQHMCGTCRASELEIRNKVQMASKKKGRGGNSGSQEMGWMPADSEENEQQYGHEQR